MAAITAPLGAILCNPPGNEVVDKGFALDDFVAGDPVIVSATPAPNREFDCSVERATGTEAHGIALKDCSAGGTVEFAMMGEMDGFVGLTPGAALSIVGGGLDTTAPTGTPQIRVVNASRIRFNLL